MRRLIAVVVLASGITATIYVALPGDGPATHVATCPVRISDDCRAQYPSLKEYEVLRFGVVRTSFPDGGVAFGLPPTTLNSKAKECVEVVDWDDCDLANCAAFPGICDKWDAGQPFTRVRSASHFVIPDCRLADGGWDEFPAVHPDCMRTGYLGTADGGPFWGGCTPFLRTLAVGAQCLDSPGNIVRGGRIEDSL